MAQFQLCNKLYLMPVDIEVLWVFIPVWIPHVCRTQSRFRSWGFSSRTYPQLRLWWHHTFWYRDNNVLKYSEESGDKVKVKQSHYRPEQAQKVPGGWGSQISRQSAHEGGKVVSPTHQPLFTPRKYSRYSFLLEAESTPGPWCGQKDYVNEKFQWHHRESNPRPSDL